MIGATAGPTPEHVRWVRDGLRQRVGTFFRNAVWIPQRTCADCAAPVDGYVRCFRCQKEGVRDGKPIFDAVMPLTYAFCRLGSRREREGKHQSEQHMWSYKSRYPGPGCVADLSMMLGTAVLWHKRCAEIKASAAWDVWTTVPSSRQERVGEHPLTRIGRSTGLGRRGSGCQLDYTELTLNGKCSPERAVIEDLYQVRDAGCVVGRHVLLIEDTWVTGASARSAALALRRAGASAVTVLCLSRWLRADGPAGTADFHAGLTDPYDPLICPVLGADCHGPVSA